MSKEEKEEGKRREREGRRGRGSGGGRKGEVVVVGSRWERERIVDYLFTYLCF